MRNQRLRHVRTLSVSWNARPAPRECTRRARLRVCVCLFLVIRLFGFLLLSPPWPNLALLLFLFFATTRSKSHHQSQKSAWRRRLHRYGTHLADFLPTGDSRCLEERVFGVVGSGEGGSYNLLFSLFRGANNAFARLLVDSGRAEARAFGRGQALAIYRLIPRYVIG